MKKFRMLLMAHFFAVIVFLLHWSAEASSYTRQHSDTISTGKKITADDLNDEFNAIQTVINGNIDASNITNASLTGADYASSSSGYIANKKYGCGLAVDNTNSIIIGTPCELVLDGNRGAMVASESLTFAANLDTGAAASNRFYYVYGKVTTGVTSFQISAVEPNVSTTRKGTDSTWKYVGSFRTKDASTAIATFDHVKSKYFFKNFTVGGGPTIAATLSGVPTNRVLDVPIFFKKVYLSALVTPSAGDATCAVTAYDAFPPHNFVLINNSAQRFQLPWPVPLLDQATLFNSKFDNVANCSSVVLSVVGYEEPEELHQ